MKLTKVNNKWDVWLPDHRAARPEWPTWEEKRLAHMNKTIKPGNVVYYVGAEEGDMAALCAMWGGKMILFEPNEKVWPNIKAIWEANNLELPLACFVGFASDQSSNNPVFAKEGFPVCASGELIGDHGFKELSDPGEIQQIRIDDIEDFTPTVISLDVEGSEGKVLRGAEQTLRKYHPKIYLSLHPEFLRDYDEWGAELRRWIIDLGYKETLLDYPLHEVHLFYEQG